MNDSFNKVDFNFDNSLSDNFSVYNFSKKPNFNPNLKFSEKVVFSFNFNNLNKINTHVDEVNESLCENKKDESDFQLLKDTDECRTKAEIVKEENNNINNAEFFDDNFYVEVVNDYFEDQVNLFEHFGDENKDYGNNMNNIEKTTNKENNNIYENNNNNNIELIQNNNIYNFNENINNFDTQDFNYLENNNYFDYNFEGENNINPNDTGYNSKTNYLYTQPLAELKNDFNNININNTNKKTDISNFGDKYKLLATKAKVDNNYINSKINNINESSFKQPAENNLSSGLCPNYDDYSEDKLKEEIKQYGLKIGSNKNMIRQLKEIWSFLNLSK
jgi:hypothetical protein